MKTRKSFYILLGIMAASVILFSCSSFISDLQDSTAPKIELPVGTVIFDSDTETLTVNSVPNIGNAALKVAQGESEVTGVAQDDGSYTFDLSSVITDDTEGGSYTATLSTPGYNSTTITYDYTPTVELTLDASSVSVCNSNADDLEEPDVDTNYKDDAITVSVAYTASDGTTISSWSDVKTFLAVIANAEKTITATYTATSNADSAKTASKDVVYTCCKDTYAGGFTVTVHYGDISIADPVYDDSSVTITAATGYSDYTWKLDDKDASSYPGITVNGNVIIFNKATVRAEWVSGLYQIRLTGTKDGTVFSNGIQIGIGS